MPTILSIDVALAPTPLTWLLHLHSHPHAHLDLLKSNALTLANCAFLLLAILSPTAPTFGTINVPIYLHFSLSAQV